MCEWRRRQACVIELYHFTKDSQPKGEKCWVATHNMRRISNYIFSQIIKLLKDYNSFYWRTPKLTLFISKLFLRIKEFPSCESCSSCQERSRVCFLSPLPRYINYKKKKKRTYFNSVIQNMLFNTKLTLFYKGYSFNYFAIITIDILYHRLGNKKKSLLVFFHELIIFL